ncbi:MAG TPA: helix-turn-helix domain-containing protein [Verrucomicrobiae bacterium]|jgi:cytoskeleton protein RodZ
MPNVGEQLRIGREERKLSISQVAEITKIRGDHLRALEQSNYSIFSAPVYIRGFVRTYSNLLKLDTPKILEQLGHELMESGQVDPTLVPRPKGVLDAAMFQLSKASRRLVWPAVGVGVVLVACIACYFYWSHVKTLDPTVGLGDGLYQSATNSGETLAIPAAR